MIRNPTIIGWFLALLAAIFVDASLGLVFSTWWVPLITVLVMARLNQRLPTAPFLAILLAVALVQELWSAAPLGYYLAGLLVSGFLVVGLRRIVNLSAETPYFVYVALFGFLYLLLQGLVLLVYHGSAVFAATSLISLGAQYIATLVAAFVILVIWWILKRIKKAS